MRMPKHQGLMLCMMLTTVISFNAGAQFGDFGLAGTAPIHKIRADGYLSVDKVQPGSQFRIAIVVEIDEGWHINANPAGENLIATEVLLPENTPNVTFGEIVYPNGEVMNLASLGLVPLYHDSITIGIQADLLQTALIQQQTLDFKLRYQACNDDVCLLPTEVSLAVPLTVVGIEETVQPINDAIFANIAFGTSSGSGEDEGTLARALSGGQVWLAFLLVFVGGILTSLTPCVYPLIPITVSIFGANESAGFLKSLLLSVVYVLGIVVTYSILGVAVASTGAVFGQVMANPWVVGFISLILVALGMSMLGVFEIRVPYALQNRLNTVGGAGYAGALAMGTVAGVIAAPCTGPALAVVLTYIATTGSLFLGFWLMFTYALGMGLLFIGIGTFSGLLSALPRSGGWMYVLENIFGIAIITLALYFLKDVVGPFQAFLRNAPEFFAIAGGLIIVGLWLSKLNERFKGISRRMQFRKACGVLLTVFGAYMVVGGLQQPAGPELEWVDNETAGLEIAKREDKLLMLDFYASWCAACNELDHKTYADPGVAAKLDNYVNVKLDFTRNSETTKALTEKYQIPGLPVVIFMDAEGTILKRLTGFVGPEEMLTILEEVEQGR
ncbi:hypothetical protein C6495_08020 [Candidatus Poribacteria bacterium]|nr:MAG: hypothetical protein C6495_08020 [Candidatus Poribacteria bacterium]